MDNSHDSVMVEDLYRKCAFKKEDLFRPKSLGTYQASYRCVVAPGDVDSEGEESFVDLFFYDGQLASGHFWGTTRDLGDVQTKGRNGYFVLPLRHIRQEGNDCFFELRLVEKPRDFDPFGQTGFGPFGYNMIDPLKSRCWGSILFYPFKISRFSYTLTFAYFHHITLWYEPYV